MRRLFIFLWLSMVASGFGCTSMHQAMAEIPSEAPQILVGDEADIHTRSAPFEVAYAEVIHDLLMLQVSYSGGCEDHNFEVHSNGKFTAHYPPEVTVHIKHFDNGDRCRGMIDEKRYFDLKGLQYPGTNSIRIVFAHNNRILDYTY